ncbi:EAL domain-containing protein [Loigolactobacillus zhaoyuanensis]|uniref:EAL domain-containing protein n=1 Tax=Loigolactobacillus zhaoyuanensis TaxID=2486017 RepID=UPI000F744B31|nr:EAL domain-containing protein [Loigolactobacillus zhaoyuanensis]
MYRYFIQPQLNKINNSLIGYELLMKKHTPDGWRPPHHFSDIPAKVIAETLIATTEQLALKIGSVSINLNRTQLMDPQIDEAIIRSQMQLRPVKLVVELTEEPGDEHWRIDQLLPMIKNFTTRGMEVSLDDVGIDENKLARIQPLIPYATEIKFALQDFTETLEDHALQQQVIFWRDLAAQHNLRLILEGIENATDDAIADRLAIDLRQGYYYGKPHLLKLQPDDPVS